MRRRWTGRLSKNLYEKTITVRTLRCPVRIRTCQRPLCLVALLLLALLSPPNLLAHTEEEASPAIGVDEALGAKLPLDLTFRDETGKAVRLGDLITSPTIILPVYYGCTNVCNFLQGGLAAVLPKLKPKPGEEYRVLSVSFDETETPELAAKYKRMYLTAMNTPFPEEGWRFLTGDAASIRRLTEAIGFRFARKGRDFLHPVASIIVAPDGTIVRYLYGTSFLAKDLTLALLEARQGRVGTTIRQVVGYCFTFDPKGKTYVFNLLRVSATVVMICAGGFLLFLLLTGKKRKPGSRDHS